MAQLNYKILPTRKKTSGKLGIYISLTFRKEVRYISTEFEIDDESQFENGKVCYRKDASIMNKRMLYVLTEYKEKLESLNLKKFSNCAQLKNMLISDEQSNDPISLSLLFQDRISRLEKENRKSYAEMNRYSCKVILSILGDIPIDYLTREHIKRLYKTMVQRGYAAGNIQMRMTHFKAAINEAIDERLVNYEEHPFKKFSIPQAEVRLMDITVEQFVRIRDLKTESQQLSLARDFFLLSFYLGGINLADLITVDLSGPVLEYCRTKSKDHKAGERRTTLSIPPEARAIINRYIMPSGKLQISQYSITDIHSLEYQNLRRYANKCLSILAKEVGITTPFSFYSGRKTFTQFAFMLGVSTDIIEYCIGQTVKKNRPIFNYVRVMQKQADAAIRKVIDYTQNPEEVEDNA